jgi:fucose permease
MFLTGITIIGFESMIPQIMDYMSIEYIGIGNMSLSMSGAYLLTVLWAGARIDSRGGAVRLSGWTMALLAIVCLLFLSIRSYAVNLVLCAVMGGLNGINGATLNALAFDAGGREAGKTLGNLHFFFAAGAIAAPPFADITTRLGASPKTPFLILSIPFAILSILFFSCSEIKGGSKSSESLSWRRILKTRSLILLGCAIGIYVGVEVSMAIWTTKFCQTFHSMSSGQSALCLSLLWTGLSAGRLICSGISSRFSERKILALLSTGSLLSIMTTIQMPQSFPFWSLALGFFMTGFFFSGHFPLIMIEGEKITPSNKGKVIGMFSAAAGVGACILPWGVSAIAQKGNLQTGLMLPAAFMVILSAGFIYWNVYGENK